MAQSKKLITTLYGLNNAKNFIDSFGASTDNKYYFFVGYSTTSATIPTSYDTVYDTLSDPYRNMLFGKKIHTSDLQLSVSRYDYQSNVVYAMYDDQDISLHNKIYYTMVADGSYTRVFKCLYNNGNTASVYAPVYNQTNPVDALYETADGYQWKYMYSISDGYKSKFATTNYFPVATDADVSGNAVPGTIDVMKVEDGGNGYKNWLIGKFSTQDNHLNGNTILYAISNTALSTNGAYSGCYIHITAGTLAGQYRKILNSYSNNTTKYIALESTFFGDVKNDCEYEIYPAVDIVGDGTQSGSAVAIAVVNSVSGSGNTVYKVKMLDRGINYKYATATVHASEVISSAIGFREATVRPILPPRGGHGYNAESELGSKYVTVGVTLSNNESNTIVANNTYRQFGILKNPKFANVDLTVTGLNGTFLVNEEAYAFNTYKVAGTVSVQTNNTHITGTSTDFTYAFSGGDYVYLLAGDGTTQISQVSSVSNGTYLTMEDGGIFTDSSATIYAVNVYSKSVVTQILPSHVTITEVEGALESGSNIIGRSTGATASVSAITRNGKIKGFDTFVQMFSYDGNFVAGTHFTADEEIVSATNPDYANSIYHSAVNFNSGKRLYVTKQTGFYGASDTLIGKTSGTTFATSNKYYPEIVYGTGEILYIENIEQINRASDQTETFKLILEF